MRTALAEGDEDAAEAAAHGLKGSPGSIGAARLAELCADLERQAGATGSGDNSRLLQAVAAEFDSLNAILRRDYCVP